MGFKVYNFYSPSYNLGDACSSFGCNSGAESNLKPPEASSPSSISRETNLDQKAKEAVKKSDEFSSQPKTWGLSFRSDIPVKVDGSEVQFNSHLGNARVGIDGASLTSPAVAAFDTQVSASIIAGRNGVGFNALVPCGPYSMLAGIFGWKIWSVDLADHGFDSGEENIGVVISRKQFSGFVFGFTDALNAAFASLFGSTIGVGFLKAEVRSKWEEESIYKTKVKQETATVMFGGHHVSPWAWVQKTVCGPEIPLRIPCLEDVADLKVGETLTVTQKSSWTQRILASLGWIQIPDLLGISPASVYERNTGGTITRTVEKINDTQVKFTLETKDLASKRALMTLLGAGAYVGNNDETNLKMCFEVDPTDRENYLKLLDLSWLQEVIKNQKWLDLKDYGSPQEYLSDCEGKINEVFAENSIGITCESICESKIVRHSYGANSAVYIPFWPNSLFRRGSNRIYQSGTDTQINGVGIETIKSTLVSSVKHLHRQLYSFQTSVIQIYQSRTLRHIRVGVSLLTHHTSPYVIFKDFMEPLKKHLPSHMLMPHTLQLQSLQERKEQVICASFDIQPYKLNPYFIQFLKNAGQVKTLLENIPSSVSVSKENIQNFLEELLNIGKSDEQQGEQPYVTLIEKWVEEHKFAGFAILKLLLGDEDKINIVASSSDYEKTLKKSQHIFQEYNKNVVHSHWKLDQYWHCFWLRSWLYKRTMDIKAILEEISMSLEKAQKDVWLAANPEMHQKTIKRLNHAKTALHALLCKPVLDEREKLSRLLDNAWFLLAHENDLLPLWKNPGDFSGLSF